MNKDCGGIHSIREESTTDGIMASWAWQIFHDEIDANGMRFSQSEKAEIRNYIFNHTGLASRPMLIELAEDCIRKAIAKIERDKLRRR